ncbi:unnamed protein product, partial [Prorocentrum cordatum]
PLSPCPSSVLVYSLPLLSTISLPLLVFDSLPFPPAPKESDTLEEAAPSKQSAALEEPDAREEAAPSDEAVERLAAKEPAAEEPAAPEEAAPNEKVAPPEKAAAPSPPSAPRVMRHEERDGPEVLLDLQAPSGGAEAELREAYANLVSLLVASVFILAALVYALWENWYWPAFLFATQSILCAACHFCDPGHGSPSWPRLLGHGWECPVALAAALRGADLCLSYLMPLQLGLMLLGPEDPVLQHAEGHSEAHLRAQRVREARVPQAVARGPCSGHGVPLDVLLLSRLGTPILVAAFVAVRAPAERQGGWCSGSRPATRRLVSDKAPELKERPQTKPQAPGEYRAAILGRGEPLASPEDDQPEHEQDVLEAALVKSLGVVPQFPRLESTEAITPRLKETDEDDIGLLVPAPSVLAAEMGDPGCLWPGHPLACLVFRPALAELALRLAPAFATATEVMTASTSKGCGAGLRQLEGECCGPCAQARELSDKKG